MPWIDEKTADALSELIAKAYAQEKEKMSENINKFIHEALGNHWHTEAEVKKVPPLGDERDYRETFEYFCSCGMKATQRNEWDNLNPQYTSESSPRSLLAEAEKAAIEKFGAARFMTALIENVKAGFSVEQENDMSEIDCAAALVTAPASIRARAIAALPWDKEGKDGE